MVDAINAHLWVEGHGTQAMLAELRRAVGEWVAAYREQPGRTQGWRSGKFGEWLASGRSQFARGLGTSLAPAAAPPLPPIDDDEPADPMSPEDYAAFIKTLNLSGKQSGLPSVSEQAFAANGKPHGGTS